MTPLALPTNIDFIDEIKTGVFMVKEKEVRREDRKKPQKSLKEKRLAKQEKKKGR